MEKRLALSARISELPVASSALCLYAIIICALSRGVSVRILSAGAIKERCEKLGVNYRSNYYRVGSIFEVSYGDKVFVINKTSFFTGKKYAYSELPKKIKSQLLRPATGISINKKEFNIKKVNELGLSFPLVVKPLYGSMGRGVILNIKSSEDLEKAIEDSSLTKIRIEEQLSGSEFRVYLIGGKFSGVVKRSDVNVVGDGESSVRKLVVLKNKNKKKMHLPTIDLRKVERYLSLKGFYLNHIPNKGEVFVVGDVRGRSSGSDIDNVTNSCPPLILDYINKISFIFTDVLCAGLDVIVNDTEVRLIEVNFRPQISSLIKPDYGVGDNLADKIVEFLFPETNVLFDPNITPKKVKENVIKIKKYNLSACLDSIGEVCFDYKLFYRGAQLNINRLVLWQEAYARDLGLITWVNDEGGPRWSITSPQRAIAFRENMPFSTSHATRRLTNNKERTKRRLSKHHISVPRGILIDTTDISTASTWFDSLGNAPVVVVKPFNGSGGKGVTSGIATKNEMIYALENLGLKEAVLEEHVSGFDYRLFVVAGKFKYAIKRQPAHVVGNGVLTVEALVEQKNVLRSNNPYSGKHPLQLNEPVIKRIKQKGYSASSVLRFGEVLYLQDIANIGAGGDSEDITDLVHPDFIEIAARVYSAFNDMAFCGLDLITKDVSQPVDSQQYAVIEVNANCDLAMHHFPTKGEPRNAAGAILDALFSESSLAPVIRRELRITGKVQGVGYRKWFARQAIQRAIDGTVSNFEDGSVRAVVQGTLSAIDDLVRHASKGPARAVVKQIAIVEHLDADTYDGFTVV